MNRQAAPRHIGDPLPEHLECAHCLLNNEPMAEAADFAAEISFAPLALAFAQIRSLQKIGRLLERMRIAFGDRVPAPPAPAWLPHWISTSATALASLVAMLNERTRGMHAVFVASGREFLNEARGELLAKVEPYFLRSLQLLPWWSRDLPEEQQRELACAHLFAMRARSELPDCVDIMREGRRRRRDLVGVERDIEAWRAIAGTRADARSSTLRAATPASSIVYKKTMLRLLSVLGWTRPERAAALAAFLDGCGQRAQSRAVEQYVKTEAEDAIARGRSGPLGRLPIEPAPARRGPAPELDLSERPYAPVSDLEMTLRRIQELAIKKMEASGKLRVKGSKPRK